MEEINGVLETTTEPDSVSIELRRGVKGDYGFTVKVRTAAAADNGLLGETDLDHALTCVRYLNTKLREEYGEATNASH